MKEEPNMAYNEDQAKAQAFDLVKTALQSASLNLKGMPTVLAEAERYAEADAKYLAKLLKDLTAALQS